MKQADEAARELGLSRSRLIADAMRDYLRHRREAQISAQIEEAYADGPTEEELRLVRKMRAKLTVPDKW